MPSAIELSGGTAPQAGPPQATIIGGVLPVMSLDAVLELEKPTRPAPEPAHIAGLAGYIRRCWSAAKRAKDADVTPALDCAMRARRGEYDPDVLQQIQQQGGGSTIYMMITSTKCRAGAALLRDVFLGSGAGKPWSLKPTPEPTMPAQAQQQAYDRAVAELAPMLQQGMQPDAQDVCAYMQALHDEILEELQDEARDACRAMEAATEDLLMEGGFVEALSEFIDDLVAFRRAFLKGPVIRMRQKLRYDANGDATVESTLSPEWERVSPYRIYPAPHARDIQDGYLIEHHTLTMGDLSALLGVDGYDDDAIRAVMEDGKTGGLKSWVDANRNTEETEDSSGLSYDDPETTIDALQFWGAVAGSMLKDWGLDGVTDDAKMYYVEAWLIKDHVIKAVLNAHPLGHKPYFGTSYSRIPGQFWGYGIPDLIADCQRMCNAAARALANNMGLSSGPQIYVNVDRLPPGEDITQIYPWKIWQISDPYNAGGGAPPVGFFQPSSNSAELMAVYERFATMADEYSGTPRYMTGDAAAGGAGRTASGLSMMVGNASKAIRQVAMAIDMHAVEPAVRSAVTHLQRYDPRPELKGDINIVARGVLSMQVKDSAQVRRNEFMQMALSNPVTAQIVGQDGIAALMRETAKGLDMDPDDVVPSKEKVELAKKRAQQAQQAQQAQPLQAQQVPVGAGQQLLNGAPVTDNFQPGSR